MGSSFSKSTKTLILAGLLALGAILSYSLYVTFSSGVLKTGVLTCLDDTSGQCFWTAHIHNFVIIKACDEEKNLPLQTGSLSGAHTHDERNILHWHDRLLYDTNKKELVDTKPLELGTAFDALKTPFTATQVFDIKNGGSCPDGTIGTWKMFVNGKKSDEWRNYVWHDHDVIHLIFNNQTEGDLEQELMKHPVSFPLLGRG